METQNDIYDTCRDFIHDACLQQSLKDTLVGFIRSRNLPALCGCSNLVDVQSIDINVWRTLLQIEAFFKKNEAFSEKERCLEAAIKSFEKSELRCKLTNKRLNYFYLHQDRLDPDMKLVISRARSWIRSVLGDLSVFIETIPSSIRVTAGATADSSRRNSLPFLKVKKRPLCTSRATPYVESLYTFCKVKGCKPRNSETNRVEFVPKNWKTYRTIACEPEGNIPFQLAFDRYVKDRLRKRGIDLSDQSRNQELARKGSIDGSFATLDLASASDTVSLNCIAWLFPTEWYQFCLDMRSSLYLHPRTKKLSHYEKMSSMGNGMTFGIETLVFAALLRASGDREGTVYGDDICVKPENLPTLTKSLKLFGFEVNHDKTWFSGPYRESCGTHWFNGTLVTPFYVRGNLKLKPFQAHNINGIASVSVADGRVWKRLLNFIKVKELLLTPFNPDTTSGILVSWGSKLQRRITRSHNWLFFSRRYRFRTVTIEDPGIRSLILWYHDSFRVTVARDEARVRSRYTVPLGRYRQRKVIIHKYDESGADYLPRWSEFLEALLPF